MSAAEDSYCEGNATLMRAARLHRCDTTPEELDFSIREDMPDPAISAPGEVVVTIDGAGVHRTNRHNIEEQFSDRIPVGLPPIPQHENADFVDANGPAVRRVRRGAPVIVSPPIADGTALACRRGRDMHGKGGDFLDLTRSGGFAEYLLTKERNLVLIPEELSPRAVAPHVVAGQTAYHAVKRAHYWPEPGDTVVPIGFGGLGQSAFPIPHAPAAVQSIVVDRSEQTLDHERELGARRTERADHEPVRDVRYSTGGQGAAIPLDFVGERSTCQRGLTMTHRGASCVVCALVDESRSLREGSTSREKRSWATWSGRTANWEHMELVTERGITLSVSDDPLRQIDQALQSP